MAATVMGAAVMDASAEMAATHAWTWTGMAAATTGRPAEIRIGDRLTAAIRPAVILTARAPVSASTAIAMAGATTGAGSCVDFPSRSRSYLERSSPEDSSMTGVASGGVPS